LAQIVLRGPPKAQLGDSRRLWAGCLIYRRPNLCWESIDMHTRYRAAEVSLKPAIALPNRGGSALFWAWAELLSSEVSRASSVQSRAAQSPPLHVTSSGPNAARPPQHRAATRQSCAQHIKDYSDHGEQYRFGRPTTWDLLLGRPVGPLCLARPNLRPLQRPHRVQPADYYPAKRATLFVRRG